jgi:hypothetical protein
MKGRSAMSDEEMVPRKVAEAMAVLGPAKSREIEAMMTALAPILRAAVETAIETRCSTLTDRIKQLEARPSLVYRGIWNENEQYEQGQFVTDHGSLFYCERLTRARPSAGSPDWRLAVKRGRDGKDATR